MITWIGENIFWISSLNVLDNDDDTSMTDRSGDYMEVRAGRILAACSDPIVYFGMVQSCQDRACIWYFMAL